MHSGTFYEISSIDGQNSILLIDIQEIFIPKKLIFKRLESITKSLNSNLKTLYYNLKKSPNPNPKNPSNTIQNWLFQRTSNQKMPDFPR